MLESDSQVNLLGLQSVFPLLQYRSIVLTLAHEQICYYHNREKQRVITNRTILWLRATLSMECGLVVLTRCDRCWMQPRKHLWRLYLRIGQWHPILRGVYQAIPLARCKRSCYEWAIDRLGLNVLQSSTWIWKIVINTVCDCTQMRWITNLFAGVECFQGSRTVNNGWANFWFFPLCDFRLWHCVRWANYVTQVRDGDTSIVFSKKTKSSKSSTMGIWLRQPPHDASSEPQPTHKN